MGCFIVMRCLMAGPTSPNKESLCTILVQLVVVKKPHATLVREAIDASQQHEGRNLRQTEVARAIVNNYSSICINITIKKTSYNSALVLMI